MALNITVGRTDDGLVFMRLQGHQEQFGKPLETICTIEPDMANNLGVNLQQAAKAAMKAKKRELVVGQPVTIPRG